MITQPELSGKPGQAPFSFDTADRLTTLADGRTLTYDTAGQPATLTDPAAAATTTYGYDDRGNRTTTTVDDGTSTTTTQAAFNAVNQLTELTDPAGTTSYTYDAAGLRATATTDDGTGPVTETYTWDTIASVPVLLADATHAYIYGTSSTPLAQVDLTDQTTLYLHGDLIGSIRSVTNAAGDVVCDADYDTYGQPVAVTTDPCGQVTRFGYAGQYTDPTGLIYLRARYYDPTSGQFLTIDPLVDTTRNPYGYTGGNPLQFGDPLGLDWWEWLIDSNGESLVNNAVQSFGAGFADGFVDTLNFLNTVTGGGDPDDIPSFGNVNACDSIYDGSYISGKITSYIVQLGIGAIAARANAARTVAAAEAAAEAPVLSISPKIAGQMETRGWSQTLMEETVAKPAATHPVWDFTSGTKQAATAHARSDGSYVVVNDSTGAVVQISDINNAGWKPVWNDPRFQR